MDKLQALREALAQQRKYEAENWPFVDDQNKPTGTGESITYHLASLYDWSPGYVLSLPPEQRDERLREIWKSFALAGDIISRYENAAQALIEESSVHSRLDGIETAIQLLTGNILSLRTELLVVKALVQGKQEEE